MNAALRFCIGLVSVLLVLSSLPQADAGLPDPDGVPLDLIPWQSWVLHGKERQFCPVPYSGEGESICAYPSRLVLALEGKGGSFSQEWLLFSKEWVPVPGGGAVWPQAVVADGKTVPVVDRGGAPCVRLKPGRHRVSGTFHWGELPEMMQVPARSGLLDLSVDGRKIDSPHMDDGGTALGAEQKGCRG